MEAKCALEESQEPEKQVTKTQVQYSVLSSALLSSHEPQTSKVILKETHNRFFFSK